MSHLSLVAGTGTKSSTSNTLEFKNKLSPSPTILVIEDNPDDLRVLANFIGDLGKVFFASTGEEGIRKAEAIKPDLVLLDIELPDIMGPAVFKFLQEQGDATVIFVTSHDNPTHQVAAMESGAADFISKPFEPATIRESITAQIALRQGEKMPVNDQDRITHTFNREYFDRQIEIEWQTQLALSAPLAVALVQIDYFNEYREIFGSLKADSCLKKIADSLSLEPPVDQKHLSRFGPEKFSIISTEVDLPQTEEWGKWLTDTVYSLKIPHGHSLHAPFVSVSVGICLCLPSPENNLSVLIENTYNSLSIAREEGQNQYSVTHFGFN